jgi:hypothetical protein
MVPLGTFGPFNCVGDQSQVMTYDASGDTAAASALCVSGEVSINGECVPITAGTLLDWVETGSNAVYVGLAVVALALLMAMGRR